MVFPRELLDIEQFASGPKGRAPCTTYRPNSPKTIRSVFFWLGLRLRQEFSHTVRLGI